LNPLFENAAALRSVSRDFVNTHLRLVI